MLAHRLQRWSNIETALGECPVFAGLVRTTQQTHESMVAYRWFNVEDGGPRVNGLCLLGNKAGKA